MGCECAGKGEIVNYFKSGRNRATRSWHIGGAECKGVDGWRWSGVGVKKVVVVVRGRVFERSSRVSESLVSELVKEEMCERISECGCLSRSLRCLGDGRQWLGVGVRVDYFEV